MTPRTRHTAGRQHAARSPVTRAPCSSPLRIALAHRPCSPAAGACGRRGGAARDRGHGQRARAHPSPNLNPNPSPNPNTSPNPSPNPSPSPSPNPNQARAHAARGEPAYGGRRGQPVVRRAVEARPAARSRPRAARQGGARAAAAAGRRPTQGAPYPYPYPYP